MTKSWQETMERRAMFELARAALKLLGHPYIHSTKTIRQLMVQRVGGEKLPDRELVDLFVHNVQTPTATKLVLNRQYKPDLAMRIAARRAQVQPPQIGIN
jgi:hypothetical protein